MKRRTLHERKEECRRVLGAYGAAIKSVDRAALSQEADNQARDEMLDEIHAMLFELQSRGSTPT